MTPQIGKTAACARGARARSQLPADDHRRRPAAAARPRRGGDRGGVARAPPVHALAELPRHVDSEWEPYVSLALAVRDRMIERWIHTQDAYYEQDAKRVYYMSLEFLMGRTLGNSLVNLGLLRRDRRRRCTSSGTTSKTSREAEWDAGLGNGGLGRLAACFLDSLATLGYPSYGYGIRYDYGIFHQRIVNGAAGRDCPTPGCATATRGRSPAPATGSASSSAAASTRTPTPTGRLGQRVGRHHATCSRRPYDTPIPGYGDQTVNTLRLWGAKAVERVRLRRVQRGRLHRRRRGARQLGEHHRRALPERQLRRRQGAPARAGVLLRLRHAAGHHPPLQEALRDVRPSRRA